MSPDPQVAVGIRYLVITGMLLGVVGLVGHWASSPLLTATLGPTAYVFAAHPRTEMARLRNAVLGHAVAIGAGVAALAAFGLWHHPSISATGAPSLGQVGAAAVAAGVTMLILEALRCHHAPAAASALLVATGLAKPGKPLLALAVGLGIILVLGPLSSRLPFARDLDATEPSARSAKPSRTPETS
ncbi:MAG: HPP family protein [Actinomycetota bacterium]|nr:HPP family protein [Actinomycetota bacterium]